jgi:hypothetical protein
MLSLQGRFCQSNPPECVASTFDSIGAANKIVPRVSVRQLLDASEFEVQDAAMLLCLRLRFVAAMAQQGPHQ